MSPLITQELLHRYDVSGPRYTSYPTAVEWTTDITHATYIKALRHFKGQDKPLSLYLHIPFCESPCYFCACNRVIRRRNKKTGDDFIRLLFKEIEMVIDHLGEGKTVRLLHWGGGTPNFLEDEQIKRIHDKISQHFTLASDAEISIEVDSRTLDATRIGFLKNLGYNRLSMGVQDFDPTVQKAVNRIQSHAHIAQLTHDFREHGIESLNYDLIYGLPHQSRASFSKTVEEVIQLRPDRIALYNFAYLPQSQPLQKRINPDDLPSADERVAIFLQAREMLLANGYDAIAMDHFALKEDAMAKAFAQGTLYRNFMGYTLRYTDDFIGFGPSAIGYIGTSFIQNHRTLPGYTAAIEASTLPIARGLELSEDDIVRQWVINSFMCQFKVDKNAFFTRFNIPFDTYFSSELQHINSCEAQHLLHHSKTTISITEIGKLFIRNICMGFDAYLKKHSSEVVFSRTI